MNRPAHVIDKNQHLARLHELRREGKVLTPGLSDAIILDFLERDPALAIAIDRAHALGGEGGGVSGDGLAYELLR